MTVCFREYCEKEGLVQFTEHNLRQTKMTYWLCEDHWRDKFNEKPKPLDLEPAQYDYEKTQPKARKWMRFIPHGCAPTWNFDERRWEPCTRCGFVRFIHG